MRRFASYGEDGWLWAINPKAASTSIRRAMGIGPKTCFARQADFDSAWSFAFVRNPWDRLVSAWASKTQRNDIRRPMLDMGVRPWISFGEFVRVVRKTPFKHMDSHVRPQCRILPRTSFLGRVETLETDWRVVMEHTGLPELGTFGTSVHDVPKTPELVAIVKELYAVDYERFYQEKKWII